MKKFSISFFISALFFYKVLYLEKKKKKNMFFNFIKFSSLFLKKFFILDEIVCMKIDVTIFSKR